MQCLSDVDSMAAIDRVATFIAFLDGSRIYCKRSFPGRARLWKRNNIYHTIQASHFPASFWVN